MRHYALIVWIFVILVALHGVAVAAISNFSAHIRYLEMVSVI